ncbi:MAG: AsmA family protein [Burkholderiales bacterium]|nr:AsmA family protein [Burkholderiales bacterium]
MVRRSVKILIGLLVVGLVVVVGAAIAVTTLGRETLVPPLAARVQALTGRTLTVGGDARIALTLPPRVIFTDIALGNVPGATPPNMIEAGELALTVELLPLLGQRVELSKIELAKARLAFAKDAAGRGNWQFAGAAAPPATAVAPAPLLPAALVIGNVAVRDSVITYRDGPRAAITTLTVRDLRLRTRAVSGDVDLRFAGAVGEIGLDLEGRVGPLRDLLDRKWPYPVEVRGTVAGQKLRFAAKVRADGTRYAFDDLAAAVGSNALQGTLAIDTGGARPRFDFDLAAPALTFAALPVAIAVPGPAAPAARPGDARLFPDTPIDFARLGMADANGQLAIDRLTLADGRDLGRVRAHIALADRKLDVTDLEVGLFGGKLTGSVTVDARSAAAATIVTRLEGHAMSLEAMLAAAGHAREVTGGRTDLVVNLTLHGNSPRAWASSASGTFRLVSGAATIINAKAEALLAWDKLADAVNPFRARDATTELACAVVNLPIANGVARSDRSLALETTKVGVAASGILDFRNETLDLVFAPQVRKGISLDVAGLTGLVRLTGPLASPRVTVDVGASAKVIASVGAAIGTGGISAAAQALVGWADGRGPGPCQIALSGAPAAPAGATATAPPESTVVAPLVKGLGKAVGKLFGR